MQKVSKNSIVSVVFCMWNMQIEQQLHNIVHTVVIRLIEGLCLNSAAHGQNLINLSSKSVHSINDNLQELEILWVHRWQDILLCSASFAPLWNFSTVVYVFVVIKTIWFYFVKNLTHTHIGDKGARFQIFRVALGETCWCEIWARCIIRWSVIRFLSPGSSRCSHR